MNAELVALAAVSLFTGVMWMPVVVERMMRLGVWGTFAYPPPANAPKPVPWADRAMRAHRNAIENLVVFAALTLAVELVDGGSALTANASWIYLGARVAHYGLYLGGVPVLRTLAFLVGWGAQLVLAAHILL